MQLDGTIQSESIIIPRCQPVLPKQDFLAVLQTEQSTWRKINVFTLESLYLSSSLVLSCW